jgi:hypothetical protein
MADELRRIWKDIFTAYFKVLSHHLPCETGENYDSSIRIANRQTQDFLIMKQECYSLHSVFWPVANLWEELMTPCCL